MTLKLDTPVGDLVSERLGRSEVLERFGIDYCCGGRQPLLEACRAAGHEPGAVIEALLASDRAAAAGGADVDWRASSLVALTAHIVATHHAFMKRELPHLSGLAGKVLAAHGRTHPELAEVAAVYADLRAEIEDHLAKEEQVLFPMIQEMEITREAGRAHCGSVNNPIAVMEHEHDAAGEALGRLRDLTANYTPPADACATYRAFLAALLAMERDLHEHIHKENNILHARAVLLEETLLAAAGRDSRAISERDG